MPTFVIYRVRRSRTPYVRRETCFVGTRTRVSGGFEILEDGIDLRSLLRLLVPTLFGDLPDRWGHSWGSKWMRL